MSRALRRLWEMLVGSLRGRLILGVAGVHAVMMSVFVIDYVGRQSRVLRDETHARALGLARALAVASPSWVLSRDAEGLAEVVHGLSSEPGLVEAMVLTPELKVLAHTRRELEGRYLEDAMARALVQGPAEARVLGEREGTVHAMAPVQTRQGRVVGWSRVAQSTVVREAAVSAATRDGLWYALAATAIGVVFALLLAQGLTRDLRALAATADQVRQGQPVRSAVHRDDELGRLATGFNSMLDSLSAQQRAEAALRTELTASEARLDRALDAANEGLWEYRTSTGQLTLWARGSCELGLPGERERRGAQLDMAQARGLLHPEDAAAVDEAVRRALAMAGRPLALQLRLKRADGAWRWFDVQGAVVHGDGGLDAVAGTMLDATDARQRAREKEALEGQLRQAQRMEALGRLAGGVAHDFNNMLAAILAHADLALGDATDPQLQEDLQAIISAARRATGVAAQVLVFSRGRAAEPTPIDLAEVVREVEGLVRPTLGRKTLTVDAPPGVAWASGERTGLVQVVLNPCVNARDYAPEDGHLGLLVRAGHVTGTCASCHEPVDGDFAEVCVSDNGPGIPADALPRIFEPFFTTRGRSGGSGLGLAVVHGLLHGWGGHVLVERAADETRFRLLLARTATPAHAGQDGVNAGEAGHRRRVLVVDDEPLVGRALARSLERRGWQATAEVDPVSALELATREPFDAVLTDYAMPGMHGLALAKALRTRGVQVPIVLMSGNPSEIAASEDVAAVLAKPLDLDELTALLASDVRRRNRPATP